MKRFNQLASGIFLLALAADALMAQDADRKSVAVTVYNNNLGVVKDVRKVGVPQGNSQLYLREVAQQIDPTSVRVKFDGDVDVLEQNYQYDLVSVDKILEKYIDKDVTLTSDKGDVITGTLLSNHGGMVIRKKEGGLVMLSNMATYKIAVGDLPDGLITRPTLVWTVNSKKTYSKTDVEVSYQTGGMNWHAEYVAVLDKDDKKLDLNSWVSIENNCGTSFKDAKLKVIAGDVNQVQSRPPYNFPPPSPAMGMAKSAAAVPQFQEATLFEYHIYNLQRPATIMNNEVKQISLFEATDVVATKKFLFNPNAYSYRGGEPKVNVIVEFENKEKNSLGVPMPKGKVRVYKSDGQGLEFVGEDLIDHTPRDEKVKLKIGDAFDLVASEQQTDYKQLGQRSSQQTYEVTLKNRKTEDVVIEVEKNVGLNWDITSSTVAFEKKNASTVTFQVPVKKGEEVKLKYVVLYTNGY